jgi:hypothetical protein
MLAKFVEIVGVVIFCCVTAFSAEAQTAAANAPGCVLLYNTTDSRFGDANVDGFWDTVDQAVGKFTTQALVEQGLDVRYFLSEATNSEQQLAEMVKQKNLTTCERFIQIARHNGGGKSTPNFSYTILLFHLEQSSTGGRTTYKVVGDFTKEYKYPLTEETFRTLAPSALGAQIASDIATSRALERAVPPSH